ncbi:hypothetical protein DFH06DRAFT_1200479 [Mycena polygramma]|nr:hypothetical protein DFH06DRAFT_1200479 [Mycena polygramma]
MFTLPQPEPVPAVPSVPLQENSAVLDRALRFFYPGVPQPRVETAMTLNELRDMLEVLIKYDMQCVFPAAKDELESYMESQPVAVYAIAFNLQWKDVALKAVWQSLQIPLTIDAAASPELDDLPASAYHNLLHYHTQCATKAKNPTVVTRWITTPNEWVWFSCITCEKAEDTWCLSDGAYHPTRNWFITYLKALGKVLVKTPGIDPRQHETMFDALADASKCTFCREKVCEQLPRFVSTLATKIEEKMDEIQLQI